MSKSDYGTMRPIHYLGSKLRMLGAVKDAIDEVDETDGLVCDVFSGSGTVSKYLLQFRDVVAVDIQEYSRVLCEASMSSIDETVNVEELINDIKTNRYTTLLNEIFGDLVTYENKCFCNAENGDIKDLYEIIENGSIYIYMKSESTSLSSELEYQIDNVRSRLSNDLLLNQRTV